VRAKNGQDAHIFKVNTCAMQIHVALDNEHASLEVHPEQRLIRLTWKGVVPGAVYRETLLQLMTIAKRERLKYWLSDGRKMGPILYEDQVWSTTELKPHMEDSGIERVAIVSSKDGLNLIAVDKIVNATPSEARHSIAFFDDVSMAQLWLLHNDRIPVAMKAKDQ
jgi:hypothetical protein